MYHEYAYLHIPGCVCIVVIPVFQEAPLYGCSCTQIVFICCSTKGFVTCLFKAESQPSGGKGIEQDLRPLRVK